jgi:hypothetical protein
MSTPTPPTPDPAKTPCPHVFGADFLEDCYRLRCDGHLVRSRILDAEVESAMCDKCGRHYGIELIERAPQ